MSNSEVTVVRDLTFIRPLPDGTYLIYAKIGDAFQPYEHWEEREDAERQARKIDFRLGNMLDFHKLVGELGVQGDG